MHGPKRLAEIAASENPGAESANIRAAHHPRIRNMDWIHQPEAWLALLTLTGMEIVLGIDNIIFISIFVGRLPEAIRRRARLLGLGFALFARVLMLLGLSWIMGLTEPLFSVLGNAISGRDILLIAGGLFLLAKSVLEIHGMVDEQPAAGASVVKGAFALVLLQIVIIDLVFSLDSVITAVGMARDIEVMVLAVIFAIIVMMVAAEAVSHFVERHPTIKMLALSFLVLIGVALIADGLDMHMPKGYIYFAMFFSLVVEALNTVVVRRRRKGHLPAP